MSDTGIPVPFPQVCALNRDRLRLPSDTPAPSPSPSPSVPISLQSDQQADYIVDYLPGNPAIPLIPNEILGFLRSYSLLISNPLDLDIAKEAYLVPKEMEWIQWSKFISYFRHIGDENVARRYHYGQLRLSRLNWLVRVFRPQHAHNMWFYELPHWSISDFAAAYTVPLLFIFATLSLVLSSMQVVLSVPTEMLWFEERSNGLQGIGRACWVFSIAVVLLWALLWLLLFGVPLLVLGWQLSWGYKHRIKPNVKAIGTV
ncbi:hypothetical protein BJ875DRAFT_421526 [Amylocarpus encephaloides]|uniref:Uncharacterized protein n=1 Tax=Amylocarpus encephaloides TaxID=45428 RepID=A0A9P7YLK0_9HELO|nr:hypothetical protein BJ875DRAFT_421526 [Amylocarpus encephaloides]